MAARPLLQVEGQPVEALRSVACFSAVQCQSVRLLISPFTRVALARLAVRVGSITPTGDADESQAADAAPSSLSGLATYGAAHRGEIFVTNGTESLLSTDVAYVSHATLTPYVI